MSLCVLVQRTTLKTTEVRGTLKTETNENGDDTTSVRVGGRLFVPIPDAACTLRYCTTGFHAYEDASCVPNTLDDLEHACPTVIATAPSPYDTLLCWGDVLLVPFSVDPMQQSIDSGMPMWIAACEATRVARSHALHAKDVVMLAGHADAVARRRKRIVRSQGQGGQKQGGEPDHVHGKRTRGRVRAKARGTSRKTRKKAMKRGESDDDEDTVAEADTETEAEADEDDEEDDATTASSQNELDEEDGDDATSAVEGSLGNEDDDEEEADAEEAEAGAGEADDVVARAHDLDAVDDAEEDEASATENEETDADTDGDTDADTATDGDNDEDADD
jgi:hypothetical protein